MASINNRLFSTQDPFGSGEAPPDGAPAAPPMSYEDEGYNKLARMSSHPNLGRRSSVSAESMSPAAWTSDDWNPPCHPKSDDQKERLTKAIKPSFLFRELDEDQMNIVLDAVVEKPVPAENIKIISQGDEGDFFYIIESGDFDVYINQSGRVEPGPGGMGDKVGTMHKGECFGELALMYGSPRAATIVSATPGGSRLWALDRLTFRRILMETAFTRRRMYEKFLANVDILKALEPYERSKIADALETVEYPPNETIIHEGEPGDCLYFLEKGEVSAHKRTSPTHSQTVSTYDKRGDYFGELALLNDRLRAASVVSNTPVKLVKLDRDGFKRLLGPAEPLMRRRQYPIPDGK